MLEIGREESIPSPQEMKPYAGLESTEIGLCHVMAATVTIQLWLFQLRIYQPRYRDEPPT